MKSRRGVIALGVLVVGVVLLASCNLPMAKAGARCPKNGAYAQDGTYVMKCEKGRWKRGITVAVADAALNAWVASMTTTTTAPPAPPRSDFGYGKRPVGTGPDQVPPGVYTTDSGPNSECGSTHYGPGGAVRSTGTTRGRNFAEIRGDDTFVEGLGSCVWTPAPSNAVPFSGDGRFRVSTDLAPGIYQSYTSNPQTGCVFFRLGGMQAPELQFGGAPGTVEIFATDVAFKTQGCGNWSKIG